MSALSDRIVEILAGMAGIDTDKVQPTDAFDTLGLDSLDLVEMLLTIEDELGVQIERDAFDGVTTVQGAIDVLEAATASADAAATN